MTIKWQDPPVQKRIPMPESEAPDWNKVVKALMKKPGKWAMVAEFPHAVRAATIAYRIRNGRQPEFADAAVANGGVFEVTSRTGEAGVGQVYARWIKA